MFTTKVLNVSQSYLFFYYGFYKDNNSTFIKMLVLFAAILKIRILNNLYN